MKNLEQVAQQMFNDYAIQKTGKGIDWRYLSVERKLEWLKEVAHTYINCLSLIKQDLSNYNPPTCLVGSYEKGFVAGQSHEIRRLVEKIEYLQDIVEQQIETFKDKNLLQTSLDNKAVNE